VVAAKRHQELLRAAIELDAEGQRALLAGEREPARAAFAQAARLYRESWAEAPPRSYGRLVGMLKSSILAGDARPAADYVRAELGQEDRESPTAAYAQAVAALVAGDAEAAATWSGRMRGGSDAFDRTAGAITALARGDEAGYADAIQEIVRDFERRADHLTGVAIADTALVLERLAARRGSPRG
jgi:hypothetical protein